MNKSESKYFNTAVKMDLALIDLLKERPLEYITVSDLCETAGVNRSTFYLHYETMADLLDETVRYLLDDFRSYFSADGKVNRIDFANRELKDLIYIEDRYLSPYLTYIKDHKEIFATALLHNKTLGFEQVYERLFENIFDPILDRFRYAEADRPYVMMYYLNGINAIVLQWLKDGCDKSVKEISKIIEMCIYGKNPEL